MEKRLPPILAKLAMFARSLESSDGVDQELEMTGKNYVILIRKADRLSPKSYSRLTQFPEFIEARHTKELNQINFFYEQD